MAAVDFVSMDYAVGQLQKEMDALVVVSACSISCILRSYTVDTCMACITLYNNFNNKQLILLPHFNS